MQHTPFNWTILKGLFFFTSVKVCAARDSSVHDPLQICPFWGRPVLSRVLHYNSTTCIPQHGVVSVSSSFPSQRVEKTLPLLLQRLVWFALYPSHKGSVRVLSPSTSVWDLIWGCNFYRCNQVKMMSSGWDLNQEDWCPYLKGKIWRKTYTQEEHLVKMEVKNALRVYKPRYTKDCQKPTKS